MAEIAPFAGAFAKAERDSAPALYRLHQTFEHHGRSLTRKSFIARVRLLPFAEGVVMPYETVPPALVSARLEAMRASRLQASPPLGLYQDRQHRIDELFEEVEKDPPHFQAPDTLAWRLTDEKTQARLAAIVSPERLYLARGQAEYEAMLALQKELQPAADDSGAHWGAMGFCNLDDSGLVTVPWHRLLSGLPTFDRADFLKRARDYFTVSEGPLSVPDAVRPALFGQSKRGPAFALVTPGLPKIAYLRIRGDLIKSSMPQLAESRSLAELDVTHLHGLVFDELFHLDHAAQERHLRYEQDWDKAFAALAQGEAQALFLVNPMRLDQSCAVADEGRLMPERSLYVHPEIPAGLVSSPVDPAEKVQLPSPY